MKKEYKIIEIYNPAYKNISEKLNEVFITYMTEKLNTESEITAKSLEKWYK